MSELVAFAIRRARSAALVAAVLSAGMIMQAPSAEAAPRSTTSTYTITFGGALNAQAARFAARQRTQVPRARNTIRTIPLWSAGVARR